VKGHYIKWDFIYISILFLFN